MELLPLLSDLHKSCVFVLVLAHMNEVIDPSLRNNFSEITVFFVFFKLARTRSLMWTPKCTGNLVHVLV